MRPVVLASLLVVGCADGAGPCASGELCPGTRIVPLTATARTARVVDLDGDGREDFIGLTGAVLSVRPGRGDGAFGEPQLHALPAPGVGLIAGDFDGDDRQDVVTAAPARTVLVWLRADDVPRALDVGVALAPVAAGDVDGDGDDDLIARSDGAMHVLLGGPDGPELHDRLEIDDVGAVALGDLAGDGGLDVAVVRPIRAVVELLTVSSTGRLRRGDVVWRPDAPTDVAFADLDGDGALDLAASARLDRSVRVSLGDGAGGWRRHDVWPVDLEPLAVLPRRGPHGPELAVIGADAVTLTLIDPGTGVARLSALTRGSAADLVAVDLDGDGIDELLYGESQLHEIAGFAAERVWTAEYGRETGLMAQVDPGGDGTPELVAHEPQRGELVVHAIVDDGLVEQSRFPMGTLDGLRVIDQRLVWWVDGDLGLLELVEGALVEVATQAVDGRIRELVADPDDVYVATFDAVWRLPRADDGLGEPEQVFDSLEVTGITLAGPGDPWIAHANGVSRLQPDGPVTVSPLRSLRGATFVDIDGDHVDDLVGCRPEGVFAASGTDGGALRLAEIACTRVEACDLDADGAAELVVMRSSNASLSFNDSHAGVEVLAAEDGVWASRGGLVFGLQADRLALDCDDVSVWTGGGLGLAHARLRPGQALRETGPRTVQTNLLGDLDGDGDDELLGDDGERLLLARPDGHGYGSTRLLAQPGAALLVALAELDGQPGREILARVTAVDGAVSHDVWSLRGDDVVRTGVLDVAAWEVLGDFDGDGRDELIVHDEQGMFTLLRLDARGQTTALALDPALSEVNLIRAADMDRDGRADLLSLGQTEDSFVVDVLRSVGDGSFAPPLSWPVQLSSFSRGSLGVGDLDQDGALDLVYAGSFIAANILICPGNGHGGPSAPCRTIGWDAPHPSGTPIVGDFDHDGANDVVVTRQYEGKQAVQVLRGDATGDLVLTPPLVVPTSGSLRRARVADGDLWLILGSSEALLLTGEDP